jgi:hypothetical protein
MAVKLDGADCPFVCLDEPAGSNGFRAFRALVTQQDRPCLHAGPTAALGAHHHDVASGSRWCHGRERGLFLGDGPGDCSPNLRDAQGTFGRCHNQSERAGEVTELKTGSDQDGGDHKPPCLLALGKSDQRDDRHGACDHGNQQWVRQAQPQSCAQYDAENGEDDHWTRYRLVGVALSLVADLVGLCVFEKIRAP